MVERARRLRMGFAFPLLSEGMEIPALPAPCENRGGGALIFFARRLFEM
jgi:hypothetical protein